MGGGDSKPEPTVKENIVLNNANKNGSEDDEGSKLIVEMVIVATGVYIMGELIKHVYNRHLNKIKKIARSQTELA